MSKHPALQEVIIRNAVDALGLAKAKSAETATAEESARLALLQATGRDGAFDGNYFRASISTTTPEGVPVAVLRAKLEKELGTPAYNRWVKANTVKGDEKVTVRVNARVTQQQQGSKAA